MLKWFCLLFITSSITWASPEIEEVKTLLQFRHRFDFFLDISRLTLSKQLGCLNKYDIDQLQGNEIKETDPNCYKIIGDLIHKSTPVFKELRLRKSLDTPNLGFFLGLHHNQLGQIPLKAILSREIDFQTVSDSEIQVNEIHRQQEPLNEREVQNATAIFSSFLRKNCHDFSKLMIEKNEWNGLFKKINFCELILTKQLNSVLAQPMGDLALKNYTQYLKSHYLQTFRKLNRETFISLLSTRPYLSFVRGPKNFKKDLRPAISYAFQALDRIQNKRKYEAHKMGILQLNTTDDLKLLSKGKLQEILDFLKEDLVNHKFTEIFTFYNSIYNRELFNQLKQQAEKKELIRLGLITGTQLGALALCAFPPSWLVSGVARLSAPLLNFLRVSSFSLTRIEQSLLCLVPPVTPLAVYSTVDAYQNFEKIHDLFYSQSEGVSLFADYQMLSDADQELFLNALFLPLEGFATLKLLQSIKPLSSAAIKRAFEVKTQMTQ
jgi:hypothetical protein